MVFATAMCLSVTVSIVSKRIVIILHPLPTGHMVVRMHIANFAISDWNQQFISEMVPDRPVVAMQF